MRGDVGFGNETVILSCERTGEPYLFKTRRSEGVRALFVGGRPESKRLYRQIETAIESTATQLGPDRRWRALLLHAMRAYGPFPDAEPPLIGDQFTLSMAFPNTG